MRSIASLLALSALSILAAACGSSAQDPHPGYDIAQSSKPRDTHPSVGDVAASTMQKANGSFADDVYRKLVGDHPSDNAAFSPYSIDVALAMTYAGAKGTTADEMAKTMHVDTLSSADVHAAFDKLDLTINGRQTDAHPAEGKTPFQLHVVNSLWGTPRDQWQLPFLDTLATDYGAGIRLTDFAKDPEAARHAINGWVAGETNDKIAELLGAGSIQPATALVLVDAIYFNGAWAQDSDGANLFDEKSTVDAPFHTLDGNAPTVKTMSGFDSIVYASGENWEAVVLPYDGVPMAMTIVVPKEGAFSSVESSFTNAQLAAIESTKEITGVDLQLPKFTIKGSTISLKQTLMSLGMTTAFTDQADFSGMTTSDHLKIDDVLHQTFVSVDEHGTEAAAATAVIAVGTAAPVKNVTLHVDRPFLFFVRDLPTQTTLFQGRVVDPSK